jgi:eukaryotic-like serine/threonine-protein kinase
MPFNVLGFALATALTQNLTDRQQAAQLDLVGGLLGSSPLGLVLVAALAQQAGTGTTGTGPGGPVTTPTKVQVPDVTASASVDDAAALLTSLGLVAGQTGAVSDQPRDQILGSDPAAGTLVDPGSTVLIVISAGKRVPDVTNRTVKEATTILTSAGFAVNQQQSTESGAPDTVLSQDPASGQFLSAGDAVTIFVSKPPGKAAAKGSPGTGTG